MLLSSNELLCFLKLDILKSKKWVMLLKVLTFDLRMLHTEREGVLRLSDCVWLVAYHRDLLKPIWNAVSLQLDKNLWHFHCWRKLGNYHVDLHFTINKGSVLLQCSESSSLLFFYLMACKLKENLTFEVSLVSFILHGCAKEEDLFEGYVKRSCHKETVHHSRDRLKFMFVSPPTEEVSFEVSLIMLHFKEYLALHQSFSMEVHCFPGWKDWEKTNSIDARLHFSFLISLKLSKGF